MNPILPYDYARCANENCPDKLNCSRYTSFTAEKAKGDEYLFTIFPTPTAGQLCPVQIEVEPKPTKQCL